MSSELTRLYVWMLGIAGSHTDTLAMLLIGCAGGTDDDA